MCDQCDNIIEVIQPRAIRLEWIWFIIKIET